MANRKWNSVNNVGVYTDFTGPRSRFRNQKSVEPAKVENGEVNGDAHPEGEEEIPNVEAPIDPEEVVENGEAGGEEEAVANGEEDATEEDRGLVAWIVEHPLQQLLVEGGLFRVEVVGCELREQVDQIFDQITLLVAVSFGIDLPDGPHPEPFANPRVHLPSFKAFGASLPAEADPCN